MGRTRRRLGEDGRVDGQAFRREDEPFWRDDVLGEEPREVAAVALQARAVDRPAGETELAPTAVHVRVDADLLADLDAGHALTEGIDGPDKLMAWDQREFGHEVAVVDVQVRPAHPDLDDLDADLARARLGDRDVPGLEAAGSVVDDRLHWGPLRQACGEHVDEERTPPDRAIEGTPINDLLTLAARSFVVRRRPGPARAGWLPRRCVRSSATRGRGGR